MGNDLYGVTADGRVVRAVRQSYSPDEWGSCDKCVFSQPSHSCTRARARLAPAIFDCDFSGCGANDIAYWEYIEDEQVPDNN